MPLFKVETISQFRMTYFIEAECVEHAMDEVVMRDSGSDKDFFDEAAQEHIGEHIFSAEKISRKRFEKLVEAEKAKGFASGMSHWLDYDRLIRKIDYNWTPDKPLGGVEDLPAEVFKNMATSMIIGRPRVADEDLNDN
jgi:hypothetical protein